MGSSFGGFCAVTYLSFFPEGLKEVFLSAGLAPLSESPDRVYAALLRKLPLNHQNSTLPPWRYSHVEETKSNVLREISSRHKTGKAFYLSRDHF
jgi:hypothetical protein